MLRQMLAQGLKICFLSETILKPAPGGGGMSYLIFAKAKN